MVHVSIRWTPKVICWVLFAGWPSLGSHAGDLVFERHVIDDQTDYSAAALIDVNHDGRIDIVCGGQWYEGPDWKRHFVAEIPRIGGRPDGFSHLEFDVNRDGWVDVITVNYRSRSIKWMEHPGVNMGPWTVHTAAEPGPMETGRLVDIDGDGQLDLLPNGANFAAWWEFRWNSENAVGEPAWIRHDLPTQAGGHGLGFGDIDGDGRGDIVGQSGWLSAPQDRRNGRWEWHPDYRIERGSIPMLVVDPDEDGDNDIVWCSAHGFGVYWHEQSQDPNGQRKWTRHAIDTSWSQGHSPLWVDMDNDGQNELVAGKRYMAHGGADPGEYDPIVAYRYQFDKATRTWNRWTLSPAGDRVGMGLDPKVADIDGDGDLDLMASGRSGLYWLENLGPGDSSQREYVAPSYDDHQRLLVVNDAGGRSRPVAEPESWGLRRYHIISAIEKTHGRLPNSHERVPLNIAIHREYDAALFKMQEMRYQLDAQRQIDARIYIPNDAMQGASEALVCMFDSGKAELANQIVNDLASRGFVCIVPELASSAGSDPLSDCVWQAMRAGDVLQACDQVDGERIGFVGDAVDGQLGIYLAAQDQRFIVTLSDASSAVQLAALQPWAGYSLAELLAAVAPRSLNVVVPANVKLATVLEQHAQQASAVFELRRASDNLSLSAGALDAENRADAYAWLQASRFGKSSLRAETPTITK